MWGKTGLDSLYDAIYHRKSVRKYEPTTLRQEALDDILNKTNELVSPLPESLVAFRILTAKQIRGINAAKAPHFLAVYAKEGLESRVNAGFKLQQMDLWLSAQGIGTCWLGMPNPTQEVKEADGLPFVIMLAFGTPAEVVYRKNISEFKRKAMSEITNLSGMEQLLEPVRLAPSGVNRQPWYVTGNVRALRLCGKNNSFISKAMFGDMPQLDMGIALCHLWLVTEKENCFFSFEREVAPKSIPSGYSYVWSINLKQ